MNMSAEYSECPESFSWKVIKDLSRSDRLYVGIEKWDTVNFTGISWDNETLKYSFIINGEEKKFSVHSSAVHQMNEVLSNIQKCLDSSQ